MSGLIPLYRLAGRRLGDPQLAVGVCVLYLRFPAVQFNALLDFRPDFVEAEQSKRAGLTCPARSDRIGARCHGSSAL
jgi:hypothetical protein